MIIFIYLTHITHGMRLFDWENEKDEFIWAMLKVGGLLFDLSGFFSLWWD